MAIPLNTNFLPGVPAPLDARTQVQTYGDLANIPVKYIGLKVYVVDDDTEYRYYATGWEIWATIGGGGGGGGSAVWGSITGTLANQTDLVNELALKFDKIGGTITGRTTILADAEGYNFILVGSSLSGESSPYARVVSVPASASDLGELNDIAFDANYLYICIATNTWMRVAIATWV